MLPGYYYHQKGAKPLTEAEMHAMLSSTQQKLKTAVDHTSSHEQLLLVRDGLPFSILWQGRKWLCCCWHSCCCCQCCFCHVAQGHGKAAEPQSTAWRPVRSPFHHPAASTRCIFQGTKSADRVLTWCKASAATCASSPAHTSS